MELQLVFWKSYLYCVRAGVWKFDLRLDPDCRTTWRKPRIETTVENANNANADGSIVEEPLVFFTFSENWRSPISWGSHVQPEQFNLWSEVNMSGIKVSAVQPEQSNSWSEVKVLGIKVSTVQSEQFNFWSDVNVLGIKVSVVQPRQSKCRSEVKVSGIKVSAVQFQQLNVWSDRESM